MFISHYRDSLDYHFYNDALRIDVYQRIPSFDNLRGISIFILVVRRGRRLR